jgi:hypothetical protein
MNTRGCLWAIVKTLLIFLAFGGFLVVAAFPWVVPMPGRGTLGGSWIGEVRSNSGPGAWLRLFLEPSRESTPRISAILTGRGTPLGGSAAVCTAGSRFEFVVSGDTLVWSGQQIDILLRAAPPSPSHLRLPITATWDGHTLEFTQKNRSLADILSESRYVGSEPESARFVSARLRKGTPAEFDSACRTLTPRS